jgi:hypothetical protein
MTERDHPHPALVFGVIALIVAALVGYFRLSADCEKKGGTLLRDAMGWPLCAEVRSIR